MAGTKIVYKLQVHLKFLFTSFKDGRIETFSKVQKHSSIKILEKSKKVQFVGLLIDSTRLIYVFI